MKSKAKIALSKIESKWKPVIIYTLIHNGEQRYSQFKEAIPEISSRMLTLKLHELVEDGIIERYEFEGFPPKVVYSLSSSGKELYTIFVNMNSWGEEHLNGKNLGYPHEDNPNNQCLAMIPLDILKHKWVLDILFQLQTNQLNFPQLLKNINGINKRALSVNLKKLRNENIIAITQVNNNKSYYLNNSGESILKIIYDLAEWSNQ